MVIPWEASARSLYELISGSLIKPDGEVPETLDIQQHPTRFGLMVFVVSHYGVHIKTVMPGKGRLGAFANVTVQVAWTAPLEDAKNCSFQPMDFYSTLPHAWVPDGGMDLYRLFLDYLSHMWSQSCVRVHNTISNTVRSGLG